MFNYRFAKPGKVILRTEYYLYDFISTLGNVGGTLGLFIGFSFSGTISYILNFIIARLNGQRIHQITKIEESPRNGLILHKGTITTKYLCIFDSFVIPCNFFS